MGPQLMARLNRTPPAPVVPGIPEPPAADGRLLGHFPYDQVSPDELIVVEPGIQLHVDAAEALDGMLRAAAAGASTRGTRAAWAAFRAAPIDPSSKMRRPPRSATDRARPPPASPQHTPGPVSSNILQLSTLSILSVGNFHYQHNSVLSVALSSIMYFLTKCIEVTL